LKCFGDHAGTDDFIFAAAANTGLNGPLFKWVQKGRQQQQSQIQDIGSRPFVNSKTVIIGNRRRVWDCYAEVINIYFKPFV